VQHLGAADAVDDVDAEVRLEALAQSAGSASPADDTRRSATSSRAGSPGEASMPAKPVGAP
jgi:hypothetical protein